MYSICLPTICHFQLFLQYFLPLPYLSRTKDWCRLQFSVILLFPRMNDQGDMTGAVSGKLPENPDNVVLDCKPEVHENIVFPYSINTPITALTWHHHTPDKQHFFYLTCLLKGFLVPSWTVDYQWRHGWYHRGRQHVALCPALSCRQNWTGVRGS